MPQLLSGCVLCLLDPLAPTTLSIVLKYLAKHVPVALLTGFLYIGMIRTLLQSKTNISKVRLTIAFVLLWTSWIIFNSPAAALEIYMWAVGDTVFMEELNHRNLEKLMDYRTMLAGRSHTEGVRINTIKHLVFVLKLTYGFANSLLLILLYRPFREPLLKLLHFLNRTWRRGAVC